MTGPSLDAMDAAVRRKSYSAMATEIQLLDDLILHINHGTALLTGHKHDRGLNFLLGLLLNRAFNSLWRAREDAVCGYPGECLTLCRSALEHWATARWVELHPRTRNWWLWAVVEEVKQPPKRPPSTDQMLKELGDLGKVPRDIYNVLSKFAHPKSVGLRWVIHFDPNSTYFHAGAHFDEHALRICLYFLVGAAQACLEPTARLQNRMLGNADAEWLETGKELSSRGEAFMRRVEDEVVEEAGKIDRQSET
jgi:hypothetical protein